MLKLFATLVSFAILLGCDPTPSTATSLGARLFSMSERAWYTADLPAIESSKSCDRLDQLQIWAPESFEKRDGVYGYVSYCPRKSWACLHWEYLPRVRSLLYPVAVMNPEMSATRWPAHGVHELLHAMMSCAGLGYDYKHEDKRVWRPATTSVEGVVVRDLEYMGDGMPGTPIATVEQVQAACSEKTW